MPVEGRDLDLEEAPAVSDSHRVGRFVPPEFSAIAGLMAVPRLIARALSRRRAERGLPHPRSYGPAGPPHVDPETSP